MIDNEQRRKLRALVNGAYDAQRLRIQCGGRLFSNFCSRLGIEPGEKINTTETELVIAAVQKSYKLLTEGVAKLPNRNQFTGDEIICDYADLMLAHEFIVIYDAEKKLFAQIESDVKPFPVYAEYLADIPGIGPALAAVLISYIDIERATYASSLFAYAGYDCGPDGKGRSRRAEHLVDREYKDKSGKTKTKKSITFNPFLKMKCRLIAESFLKANNETYRPIYDEYKFRLENHAEYSKVSKGHRHAMALRYMIKRFLADLYFIWREKEGLETFAPYSEAKLGIVHQSRERLGAVSDKPSDYPSEPGL